MSGLVRGRPFSSSWNAPKRPARVSRPWEAGLAAALCLILAVAASRQPDLAILAGIGAVAMAVLARWPPLAVIAVMVVASTLGPAGAHYLVPGVGLPVLEVLLALASFAVAASLLTGTARFADALRSVLPWLPAAAWGMFLVVFDNRGSLISGVREAMIFFYPVLIATPLCLMSDRSLRETIEKHLPLIVALGVLTTLLGAYNAVTGNASETSTGQLRYLGSTFGPPLFAGAIAALLLYLQGRASTFKTLVGASSLLGLLLVNHRSAYLAAIVAGLAYMALRTREPRAMSMRLWGLTRLGAVLLAVVLVATPFGRAGVARFETITHGTDPNIEDRLQRSQKAASLHGLDIVHGVGVGLAPTELGAQLDKVVGDEGHYGIHNSYLSAFHTGGLIGFGLLAMPILGACLRMFRRRSDPLIRSVLTVAVFSLTMAAFNVFLENSYGSIWVWVSLIVGARMAAVRTEPEPDGYG